MAELGRWLHAKVAGLDVVLMHCSESFPGQVAIQFGSR